MIQAKQDSVAKTNRCRKRGITAETNNMVKLRNRVTQSWTGLATCVKTLLGRKRIRSAQKGLFLTDRKQVDSKSNENTIVEH